MNVLVLIFAVVLCTVNAVLWTLYSEMPIAGAGWLLAAGACIVLRKWSVF